MQILQNYQSIPLERNMPQKQPSRIVVKPSQFKSFFLVDLSFDREINELYAQIIFNNINFSAKNVGLEKFLMLRWGVDFMLLEGRLKLDLISAARKSVAIVCNSTGIKRSSNLLACYYNPDKHMVIPKLRNPYDGFF